MNKTDYITTFKSKYGVKSSGIDTKVLKTITFRNKQTKEVTLEIPQGSNVHVDFPENYSNHVIVIYNDEVKSIKVKNAYWYLKGFMKSPTLHTLEKYVNDGIAKTILGNKTEPDGTDQYGAPSWLLALGMI